MNSRIIYLLLILVVTESYSMLQIAKKLPKSIQKQVLLNKFKKVQSRNRIVGYPPQKPLNIIYKTVKPIKNGSDFLDDYDLNLLFQAAQLEAEIGIYQPNISEDLLRENLNHILEEKKLFYIHDLYSLDRDYLAKKLKLQKFNSLTKSSKNIVFKMYAADFDSPEFVSLYKTLSKLDLPIGLRAGDLTSFHSILDLQDRVNDINDKVYGNITEQMIKELLYHIKENKDKRVVLHFPCQFITCFKGASVLIGLVIEPDGEKTFHVTSFELPKSYKDFDIKSDLKKELSIYLDWINEHTTL